MNKTENNSNNAQKCSTTTSRPTISTFQGSHFGQKKKKPAFFDIFLENMDENR